MTSCFELKFEEFPHGLFHALSNILIQSFVYLVASSNVVQEFGKKIFGNRACAVHLRNTFHLTFFGRKCYLPANSSKNAQQNTQMQRYVHD